METIKDRLRQLRDAKEMKQEEIAQALNVSRASYSSYENGITPPTNVCIKLAQVYDVSVDYLLGLTVDPKPASGELGKHFFALAKLAGDEAPKTANVAALFDAAIRYYRSSAPCGNAPLQAFNGFCDGLRAALIAAVAGDAPALIDGANAAAVAALEATKMPAAFYKQKGDTVS